MELFVISSDEFSNKRKPIDPDGDDKDYFAIIQSSGLANLVQKLLCPFHKSADVRISLLEGKMCVLTIKIEISCVTCNDSVDEMFLCDRAVIAFRRIGYGFNAMKD